MIEQTRVLTTERFLRDQRRTNAIITIALLILTFVCALFLGTNMYRQVPMIRNFAPYAWISAGVVFILMVGALWRRPVLSVYILLFAALMVEQWPITGVQPWSAKLPVFQTLSGALHLPVSISPVEILIAVTFPAVLFPAMGQHRSRFFKGNLFPPAIILAMAVIISLVYGIVGGPAGTTFNINAAWEEGRSIVYLVCTYVLVSNLISTRQRLNAFVWVFIAGVGIKGLQGVVRFINEQRQGLNLEAITGHEDVVFFGAFFVLLATFLLFEGPSTRTKVMGWLFPAVLLTEFATSRRIAFLILPFGLSVVAISLYQRRRQLFKRVVPATVIVLALYTGVFWNHTDGLLGQPVRAIRSQIGYSSTRDYESDLFRQLEEVNIEQNIRSAPITGLGFGRPYTFYVQQPTLEQTGFIYWTYITHNAVFWVWMSMGIFGFIAFWYLLGSGVIEGLITFRRLSDGYLQALAITTVAIIVMQIFFSYGDLGLTYARPMIFLGAMLGMLVRLPGIARETEHRRETRDERPDAVAAPPALVAVP